MNISAPLVPGIYGRYRRDLSGSEDLARYYDHLTSDGATSPRRTSAVLLNHGDCLSPSTNFHREDAYSAAVVGSCYPPDASAPNLRDAAKLIKDYRSRGIIETLSRLRGSFSLLLVDKAEQRVFLAVDRFNRFPNYWKVSGEHLLFGPTADAIRFLSSSAPSIANQALFNYVFFHIVPGPGTIYDDVFKLPAAHYLEYSRGEVQVTRYWHPTFLEHSSEDRTTLMDELQERLLDCVSRTAPVTGACAFLSGGLDSSTVTGMLARSTGSPVDTYSIGFDAAGYDEIEYARVVSKHFGTKSHEYYVTPDDVLDALPRIISYYDEPFGNSSAIPAYYCAKMAAEDGQKTILAGDGGDEIFAGNARYAQQNVFGYYQLLPAWLRKSFIEPAIAILPERYTLIRKANSYIRQANIPLPRRLQDYNFIYRIGASAIFDRDFLRSIDQSIPQSTEDRLYHEPDEASDLNRMLYLDWHHTLADNDLRKVGRVCHMAGIEVGFPLLHDDLVEFSCRVPSRWKMPHNRLRGFFKDALIDFLPKAVIEKKKHGFGLPFGVWMQTHSGLRDLVTDCLSDLNKRGFLKPSLIEKAIDLHRREHSAYYGELIWILVALEIWLSSHESA